MIGLDTPKRMTRHCGQQHMVDQCDQTLYWNRFPDRPGVVSQEGNDGVGKDVELVLWQRLVARLGRPRGELLQFRSDVYAEPFRQRLK